ncbi:hypothetical protein OF83DRAFT_1030938, partial [Amylostereum chailletii]
APIFKLPDETLGEIFITLRYTNESSETWDWTKITHVCSRWRNVAVQHLKLWSHI